MLAADRSYDKVMPLLSKIVNPLRMALAYDNNDNILDTLNILQMVLLLNCLFLVI
jgi:hypothetical protein